MKKLTVLFFSLVTVPFYAVSYTISKLLHVADFEDMPTIAEWLTLYAEV